MILKLKLSLTSFSSTVSRHNSWDSWLTNLNTPDEEPVRRYVRYTLPQGKGRAECLSTLYLACIHHLIGDKEGRIQEQQIATIDKKMAVYGETVLVPGRHLCSTADGWHPEIICNLISYYHFIIWPIMLIWTSYSFLLIPTLGFKQTHDTNHQCKDSVWSG